jgi:hypothetical protein
MAGPIDYTLNAQNPAAAFQQGIQQGQQWQDRQVALKQAQQQQDYQKQMQADFAAAANREGGVTPNDLVGLSLKYPQMSEGFKRTFDMLPKEQQTASLGQMSDVYAALSSGDNTVAYDLLSQQAAAARNSGNEQDAKGAEAMIKLIEASPETARGAIGLRLASAMGPKEFAGAFNALEGQRRQTALEGSVMTKAQAEANSAATAAKFSESKAVQDLVKGGWDITKLQNDIQVSRDNVRIATLDKQIARETNDLKRQELQQKLDAASLKRDEAIKTKTAQAESAYRSTNNSINTIDRLLANPSLPDVVGGWEGTTIADYTTGIFRGDEEKDAIALIETVQSQQFMDNLKQAKEAAVAFGGLTEKEGDKIQGYISNLKRAQGEKQFMENLQLVRDSLVGARGGLEKKTGVPAGLAPKEQISSQSDLDSLLNKYAPE